MSQQQPRRPANLPAGTSSLSDRIAALQRKGSSSKYDSSGNGVGTSNAAAVHSAASFRSSSTGNGPTSSSVDAPSNRSISAGSQAVKDRIARFQNSEKPLLPKSSFGAPSPMGKERHSNALRPYPGANASGSGSGQWGENILRPQLTGGTWLGAGEGKGWADAGSLRPQLTGTGWAGSGGGSYSPGNSLRLTGPKSPTRQRDAFLDLEDENRLGVSPQRRDPTRRGSSFSEAQMAAASSGLSRTSRASSMDGSEQEIQSPAKEKREEDVNSTLASLPDTPSKSLKSLHVQVVAKEAPLDQPGIVDDVGSAVLPSPPSDAPVTSPVLPPRDVRSSGDIEISVGGASPAKMEHLKRTLSGSHEEAVLDLDPDGRVPGPIPSPPTPFIQEILSLRNSDATQNIVASSDDGASDIGRLAIKSDIDEEEANSSDIASPAFMIMKLPSITVAATQSEPGSEPSDYGEADSSSITPSFDEKLADGHITEETKIEKGELNAGTNNIASLSSLDSGGEKTRLNGSADSDGTVSASNSAGTVTSAPPSTIGGLVSISEAQRRAKEVISLARTKSQSVQRPPVGRPMTVAEMDASDDEYEPGWASVISTSSNRT